MGLRINTNVASLAAQRALSNNTLEKESSYSKLASGSRITKAADDAAGLAISEKLKANIRGLGQAHRNANDGISLVQIAEGGLNEVSNILIRLRELAVQAASDTVGDEERKFTNLEYQSLKEEIDRIATATEFNGKKLLNGAGDKYEIQVGVNSDPFENRIVYDAKTTNASTDSLGISEASVITKEAAQASLGTLDKAITAISGQRAELGAIQNRLTSTVNNLQVATENMAAANSRIRDVDYAAEMANNTKVNILGQAGTSVLGQANATPQAVLKLLG